MSAYSDFVAFVDGNDGVPYFSKSDEKYVPRPHVITEEFSYGMKRYIKSFNRHYVGVFFSNFVRPIFASDYKKIKQKKDNELYLKTVQKSKIGVQLQFEF